jgi:hypothetical protein
MSAAAQAHTIETDAPRPKRRYGNREAAIQAGVVEWIRACAPQVIVFAVPNGGLRSKSEAGRMKWTGTLAGIPDLCILAPGGIARFIEIKGPGGTLSEEQKSMILALAKRGAPCAVVTSIDDARAVFEQWGIQTREVPL